MLRQLVFFALIALISSFRVPSFAVGRMATQRQAVQEVDSVASFDAVIASTPAEKLVVIDYSTTWCGPCKIVLPKYVELSEKYPDVTFLKCIGDANADASALMKREGIRSVPAFHMWKNGEKVDTINGARIDDVEQSVKSLK